jgi:PAS domain S-box-containing protein
VRRKDGRQAWVAVSWQPIYDSEGARLGYRSSIRDIEDRKRAETALRESESRFRAFVDHAADAFCVFDEQHRVVDANREACENHGYTREELIGSVPQSFDPDMDAAKLQWINERVAAGETCTFETRNRLKDGTVYPVEVRVRQFEFGGRHLHLASARDISERKRAEERASRLAAIVESSDDAILSKTLEGVIISWNKGAERIYGYMAEEAIGEPVSILADPAHPDETPKLLARVGRGDSVDHYETVRRRKDGKLIAISLTVSPIRDASGRVVGASTIARDITERKQAEAALRASEAERRRAETALQETRSELERVARVTTMGALTASIAHEVNQPLAGVITSANAGLNWLAANPPNLSKAREALERVRRDGTRAGEVIARIRGLLKRTPPAKTLSSMNSIIRDVLALTSGELREHNIETSITLDSGLPSVLGDTIQLQQVLLNLVTNAIEAMAETAKAQRALGIQSSLGELDGKRAVVVAVSDAGIGLGDTDVEQLFEAFHTTKTQGMGMGLWISRSIIEEHGGRLTAQANSGPGATFVLTIPAEH